MDTIKDLLEGFRNKTLEILSCLEKEQYENLDMLFSERQKIIDVFIKKPEIYETSKIAEEIKKTDIIELDEKANKIINEKMLYIKQKIVDIGRRKTIKSSYGNRFHGEAVFLNKKVY